MPAAAKSPLNSKNPATVAKKMYAGSGIVGNGGHGEVVCPLFNADGSICRKKCVGVSHPKLWKSIYAGDVYVDPFFSLRTLLTGPFVSIFGGHIQITGFRSFQQALKLLQRWSIYHPEV